MKRTPWIILIGSIAFHFASCSKSDKEILGDIRSIGVIPVTSYNSESPSATLAFNYLDSINISNFSDYRFNSTKEVEIDDELYISVHTLLVFRLQTAP